MCQLMWENCFGCGSYCGQLGYPRSLVIIKQDNESFGFEIQTYKLQHQNVQTCEMCTYVCKVHEDSPSDRAGLKTDINGICTEGFNHQQTVDLIKASGNHLRIQTVNGTKIRRSELEAKLLYLKQDFREKWAELRTVLRKEQELIYGTVDEQKLQETIDSIQSTIFQNPTASCSFLNKHRVSSGSSWKSQSSSMTDTSDDGLWQMSVFEDDSASEGYSRQSSLDEDFVFMKPNGLYSKKSSLTRHRSISVTSSGSDSTSPNWDTMSLSSLFGTLPRKGRRGSIRKQFLKFIPGVHRSVVEEESPV
ncbi:hypothetical protein GDO86_020384 [Hymenochirus boettgeri]|uniref:PDZ domain-containing protein n=1 Tax=Hymenochirus boettgeri TaxID=247094 RepID=A0A8T2ID96_9PIPI|nr:hypothetical protein GDO86_020384 [Hymenochirus boettgeri]